MPHVYNRNAFQGLAAASDVLLRLYCSLVGLELGLKDHFSGTGWRNGHRIGDWVAELGEAALGVQLETRLSALQCTDRDGNPAPVAANSYPGIRYVRHETDFPGASTSAQIGEALQVVSDIINALRGRGVAL
jgi:hypothetical protein